MEADADEIRVDTLIACSRRGFVEAGRIAALARERPALARRLRAEAGG